MLKAQKFQEYVDSKKRLKSALVFDEVAAREQLAEMSTQITPFGIRSVMWYFNKVFRHLIRGLYLEQSSFFKNVKTLLADGETVILMPVYKSLADFFILTYIQTFSGLEVTFTYGNFEDNAKDKGSESWFKKVGYIPSRRSTNQGL